MVIIGLILPLLCATGGCGGPVDLVGGGGPSAYEFAEDSDPSLADQPFVSDELLVQPFPGSDAETTAALYADVGAVVLDEIVELQLTTLQVDSGKLETVAAQLSASGWFEEIHRNYIFEAQAVMPNDPLFDDQGYLSQANIPDAWLRVQGSDLVPIAVIDTGIDPDHLDLADRVQEGWNVRTDSDECADGFGHGTGVAGVFAAATDNGEGIAGVSRDNPLIVIKATDDRGRASSRDLAAGILSAVNRGARVVNVSFAPLHGNRLIRAACRVAFSRGALVVLSAGNGGKTYKAKGYNEALFVGAVNSDDTLASFSNRGPFVDLVAPGVAIRTTAVDDAYRLASGTSFASPIVAGVAALCFSVNPQLRPISVQQALTDSAVDLEADGRDDSTGHGLIDALAAVRQAEWTTTRADTAAPFVVVRTPEQNSHLSGKFKVRADVVDDQDVADVILLIDGIPFATDTREPYVFAVDASAHAGGSHTLTIGATDWAGNASEPAEVHVSFDDASNSDEEDGGSETRLTSITFLSPASGARVDGFTSIEAEVSDEDGLASVEWFIDSETLHTVRVSGRYVDVSIYWSADEADPGSHTITLIVTDARGNRTSANLILIRI